MKFVNDLFERFNSYITPILVKRLRKGPVKNLCVYANMDLQELVKNNSKFNFEIKAYGENIKPLYFIVDNKNYDRLGLSFFETENGAGLIEFDSNKIDKKIVKIDFFATIKSNDINNDIPEEFGGVNALINMKVNRVILEKLYLKNGYEFSDNLHFLSIFKYKGKWHLIREISSI